MDLAFMYISNNHPLELETSYPYKAKKGSCQFSKSKGVGAVSAHKDVARSNKAALEEAVSQTVVSVAIEADQKIFQSYHTGVIKASAGCGTRLDHGVAVVGYGTESGSDYWIVRNSWGPSWGDQGYVKLERVDGNGVCGVQMQPVYPTVA
jgi:C1A family cysteine protease